MELWFRARRCSVSPFQWRPSWVWFKSLLALLKRPSTIFAACTVPSQLAQKHSSMPPVASETAACFFFWGVVCIFFHYWSRVWREEGRTTTLGWQRRELFPPHHQIPPVITSVEGNLVLKTIRHSAIVPPASGISNDAALGCVMGSRFGATGWKAVNVSIPLCCLIYFVFKVNRRCPCCESWPLMWL